MLGHAHTPQKNPAFRAESVRGAPLLYRLRRTAPRWLAAGAEWAWLPRKARRRYINKAPNEHRSKLTSDGGYLRMNLEFGYYPCGQKLDVRRNLCHINRVWDQSVLYEHQLTDNMGIQLLFAALGVATVAVVSTLEFLSLFLLLFSLHGDARSTEDKSALEKSFCLTLPRCVMARNVRLKAAVS